jgi:hypothetical protein
MYIVFAKRKSLGKRTIFTRNGPEYIFSLPSTIGPDYSIYGDDESVQQLSAVLIVIAAPFFIMLLKARKNKLARNIISSCLEEQLLLLSPFFIMPLKAKKKTN